MIKDARKLLLLTLQDIELSTILALPLQERELISVINPELFCKSNRKREIRGNKLITLSYKTFRPIYTIKKL